MRPDVYTPHSTEPEYEHRHSWAAGGSWLIKLLILAAVVGLGAAGWKVLDPLGGMWLDDPDKGFAAGVKSDKPVLVLYTSDRWQECQQLNRDVLQDLEIKAFLRREFVRVKVDMTRPYGPNNGLAMKAKVKDLPTLIVYSPRGREIRRVVGSEEVGAWIHRKAHRQGRSRLDGK
jgi:hypothetical protein